jgi:hypothetical protein
MSTLAKPRVDKMEAVAEEEDPSLRVIGIM